ncbi:MAG: enoyl-CoA hydratase-related protein, partial [Eubacteriales bacterium]
MPDILIDAMGSTLHLTLNRPAKKNALTPDMYTVLANSFNEAAGDFSIRTVVTSGAGGAFTGG